MTPARVSWKSSHLVFAAAAALAVGILTGGLDRGHSSSTVTPTSTSSQRPSAWRSVASTSVEPPVSTLTPTKVPLRVLLGPMQSEGTRTTTPFTTVGGPWYLGWAFHCANSPRSGPTFQVFVAPAGGRPATTPAVSEAGDSGQSVTRQTGTGSQELMVQAFSSCIWVVKVTGRA